MLSSHSSSPASSIEDDNDDDHYSSGSSIIGRQQQGTSNTNGNKDVEGGLTPKDLSIAQAKRETSGYVKIRGTIVSLSPVYHMIRSVTLACAVCGKSARQDHHTPKYKPLGKEKANALTTLKMAAASHSRLYCVLQWLAT